MTRYGGVHVYHVYTVYVNDTLPRCTRRVHDGVRMRQCCVRRSRTAEHGTLPTLSHRKARGVMNLPALCLPDMLLNEAADSLKAIEKIAVRRNVGKVHADRASFNLGSDVLLRTLLHSQPDCVTEGVVRKAAAAK